MQPRLSPADISQPQPGLFVLSGCWTARTVAGADRKLEAIGDSEAVEVVVDGSQLEAIDSVGVWLLQQQCKKIRTAGRSVRLRDWPVNVQKLLDVIEKQIDIPVLRAPRRSFLEKIGRNGAAAWQGMVALLSFIGECALALVRIGLQPNRWRWRQVLKNIEISGFDALPIVGLTAFLLGIVVAYQGADQLRHYGANIFVVDLVGYAMLREFSPLITAIIIAGRSGSAYAAQIGTMVVTEEIDGMRTIGIEPIDFLVLPKIIALMVALPLLTVFADVTGVFGGMFMARSQLDVGFHEFLARFGSKIGLSALLVGVGKAVVFAAIIAIVGCYQGFRTKANADSVGRQTTRSVVQSIFIVIILDSGFSVIFSILGL
ncbi:MlaE family lipid ABC transporter permease subunit [Desulfoprunum benzoelyticum]|uniref:Phospholipid/cholesterol/gamma-HCH transport system permease protein n=1 Tax=Desulfoprunum benzoelyticum TaxID=1506996 RepID=A0A840UTB1_9BACT|nr:MlaE family lipid ABC transporter permease subunit [Desulfoprunum benzoelyticum]MBB5349032.1 phospholipid/cholesterol/gamma-HCH transport system permease protein [Desulfoprunum benzoelyticum]MBM9530525.1 MlaE family lipid ABC transporter permease subunit [Desulfoprunum benzoelyticum]